MSRCKLIFSLIACIALLLNLSGCIAIFKEGYYTTSSHHENIKLERIKYFNDSVPIGGNPNQIVLYTELATIQISSPRLNTTAILVGPAFFPIIPAFWSWFEKTEYKQFYVLIDIYPKGSARVIEKDITITTPDLKIHYPVNLSEFKNDGIQESTFHLKLYYDVNPEVYNNFDLNIGGVSVDGKGLMISPITFEKSGGFAYGM